MIIHSTMLSSPEHNPRKVVREIPTEPIKEALQMSQYWKLEIKQKDLPTNADTVKTNQS